MRKPIKPDAPTEVELAHPAYQPTKAEKEEPLEFPDGTVPKDLAQALMRSVRVRYVNPRRQR